MNQKQIQPYVHEALVLPPPRMSLVLTLNNRSDECQEKVYRSLIGQSCDQIVIVLDRPEPGVEEFARNWWARVRDDMPTPDFVTVKGQRGWLGPARAWNLGFMVVRHEITCMISSEVIQQPGNFARIKEVLSGPPMVVFGKAEDDGPIPLVTGPEPSVLCSSKMPRPLGFIWAMPTWILRSIGGFDEGFMDGYWYDDDDLTYRIWKLGIPYLFDDSISGIHQHHDRKDLNTTLGREMIAKNRQYIIRKWGSEHPWNEDKKTICCSNGRTIIYPPDNPAALAWYRSICDGEVVL